MLTRFVRRTLSKFGRLRQDGRIRNAGFGYDWVCVNVGLDERFLSLCQVSSERNWTVLDVDNQIAVNGRLARRRLHGQHQGGNANECRDDASELPSWGPSSEMCGALAAGRAELCLALAHGPAPAA